MLFNDRRRQLGIVESGAEREELPFQGSSFVGESAEFVVGVALIDGGFDLGDRGLFGGVDHGCSEFVERCLRCRREWLGPVVESVGLVGDLGEFVVFDDVGPVFEDPVAPRFPAGVRDLQGFALLLDGELAVEQGFDDLALVGRGGG
ncbi:MAG: hypothetical protein ABJ382_11230, partial [Ilumatobacter sp.]